MTISTPSADIVPDLSNAEIRRLLRFTNACGEALAVLGDRDGEAAWTACERGDLMLWLAARVSVERTTVVRAVVACVQPAVTAYVPAGETRPQAALDAVLRWAADPTEANLEAVRVARRAAAYAAAADAAADAAAYVAAAADAAAYVAYVAAAADAAAYAAYVAARRTARTESLRASADTVREHIPYALIAAAARSYLAACEGQP